MPGETDAGPLHRIVDGEVRFNLPGVARATICGGTVVALEAAPNADTADLEWLARGHLAQVAALQQGEFALRAAGVVIAGRAIALCGWAAAGSSSTAAVLATRGAPVLGDGWLHISVRGVLAHPSTGALALWPDVAEALGLDTAGAPPVRPGLAKQRYAFAPATAPAPLAAIVVLHRADELTDVARTGVTGGSKLEQLAALAALDHLALPLGLDAERFVWLVALAACPVHHVLLNRHGLNLAGPAAEIESLVAG